MTGPQGGRQYRFARGPNGQLQPDGTLQTRQTWLKTKFGKEIRLLLGCAMVRNADGGIVGKRCRMFSYTNCWVVHISKFQEEHVPTQIRRVKRHGKAKRWVTGARPAKSDPAAVLYQADNISRINGISKSKCEMLMAAGFDKVSDLLLPRAQTLCSIKGIGPKSLAKWVSIARSAKPGEFVECVVDHRKCEHPYKSRFPDSWEKELALDLRKNGVVCITELIEHMINETREIMVGTPHEHDWMFYHDALTQLTDKRTKDWMVSQGYMRRWLLPIHPCNAGTVYAGRPVGNTPEVMPWDCCLNQDVHVAVDNHSSYFKAIGKDHPLYPKRFSKATPSIMEKSYSRILDPVHGVCPSSKRIIQDIERCWGSHIDIICEHRGKAVDGIGSRNGHRYIPGLSQKGGVREKKESVELESVHPDAAEACEVYLQRSITRHSHSSSSNIEI